MGLILIGLFFTYGLGSVNYHFLIYGRWSLTLIPFLRTKMVRISRSMTLQEWSRYSILFLLCRSKFSFLFSQEQVTVTLPDVSLRVP